MVLLYANTINFFIDFAYCTLLHSLIFNKLSVYSLDFIVETILFVKKDDANFSFLNLLPPTVLLLGLESLVQYYIFSFFQLLFLPYIDYLKFYFLFQNTIRFFKIFW